MSNTMKLVVAALTVTAFCLVASLGSYLWVRNSGRTLELGISRQYKDMMADYGQCREGVSDQHGVAQAKRDAINKIISDVIEKRSKEFLNPDGSVNRTAVVAAIKESYPDLKGLNIYDQLFRAIEACRSGFSSNQTLLADQIQIYDQWRTTGSLLHPFFVRLVGFPSDALSVRIGDHELTRQEALDHMSTVVMDKNSQDIFTTGQDKKL